jgi:signal transduction histidine kinase
VTTTTDPEAGESTAPETARGGRLPGRSGLDGLSVRVRLTAAVALLTASALASAGLLVYTLESAHVEKDVRAQIAQEVAEFEHLRRGKDPDTARPFADVAALIDFFLRHNVPDDDAVLVGYWGGAARLSSPSSPHPGLIRSAAFLDLVEQRLERGGSQRMESAYGEVIVTVAPVHGTRARGALVIVNFMRDHRAELTRVMQTYAVVSLLMLGLVTASAAWLAGRLLSPLRTLRDTAREITGSDLSRRIPEQGNDDITALTRTFNDMVSRLERAFTGQRQFLDDAGHELRTPLTVLSGHLELVDPTDPEEVRATRDLLLEEVDRMTRLVEDLIWLAKTDRPDFFVMGPVAVRPHLEAVLEKCRALGTRDWRIDEAPDLVVRLDAQRITQALLQLAHNAVKHTTTRDQIALGAAADAGAGELRLWVRDTGRGVADSEKDRIFHRFARGPAVAGDDGFGLGLGLSIVHAIAEAHGGTVSVDDPPGNGARFVLRLPLKPEDLEEDAWQGS